MSQYFKDSLAICRAIGHPSLFLTMTCNSKWPEIQEMLKLLPNVDPVDAPDIVSRVFKLKLDQLLDLIKKKNYFGKCIGVMHVIEFQKRGFPHVHILIWMSPESRPNSIEKVDQLVSAEIPDKNSDPIACEAVKNYMMHGPCESADLENVCNNATSKKSKLEAWFVANSEFPQARNFTYSDFPTQFTWIKKTTKWKLRQRGDVVGRLAEVHATTGELLYLRMLLLRCKCALSFSQLRTIDGTTYDTFKEACGALVSDPLALWEKHWPALSDDVLYIRRKIPDNIHLTLSEYEIQNYALAEIEKLLNDVGKSLRDFHMMPFPDERFFTLFVNHLIVEETSYKKEELRLNHDKAHKNLNSRQLDVYNAVVDNVNKNKGGMFFVYGSGGCGKTFLWQTLSLLEKLQ
ncbi:uncharacterized protein LOC141691884 [Apium graveolens]|uniref:uncharacterized protein LOC141691884 n=1 Tax=Apium graveolens TaxID=4045 RepID=UPI003D78CF91